MLNGHFHNKNAVAKKPKSGLNVDDLVIRIDTLAWVVNSLRQQAKAAYARAEATRLLLQARGVFSETESQKLTAECELVFEKTWSDAATQIVKDAYDADARKLLRKHKPKGKAH